MANPLDTGSPILPVEVISASAEEILTNESVDVLIMALLLRSIEVEVPTYMDMIGAPLPGSGNYLKEMLDLFSDLKTKTGKEIVVVFDNRANQVEHVAVEKVSRKMRMAFLAQGIPVFPSVDRALRAIRHAVAAMRSGTAVSRM
jgi:hypothetical protein